MRGMASLAGTATVSHMTSLPRVKKALRHAHAKLPEKDDVQDLAYLMDVDPYGSESLVVYVKLRRGFSPLPAEKRVLESNIRKELQAVVGYSIFFRWFSEEEEGDTIVTKSGLVDRPISALA